LRCHASNSTGQLSIQFCSSMQENSLAPVLAREFAKPFDLSFSLVKVESCWVLLIRLS
jgi:ABC-type thiamine transport system substrate-binding protein